MKRLQDVYNEILCFANKTFWKYQVLGKQVDKNSGVVSVVVEPWGFMFPDEIK